MMSGVTDAPTPAPAPRAGLRAWLRDLGAVVAQGARLWVRTWPLLLVIALLAVAGRHAAGWAAVNASTVNNTLGWAVLVLAPLSMVAGIVAMLHVLRRDLPTLDAIGRTRAPDDPASGHERGLVDVLASVFVPFLALYASYGLLAEDRARFLNTAAYREFMESVSFTGGDGPDGSFVDLATGWGLVAVVVVAVVLRWLLGRWEGRSHRRALAFAGAYIEAFWLLAVAAFATQLLDERVGVDREPARRGDRARLVAHGARRARPGGRAGRRSRERGRRRAGQPRRPRRHPAGVAHRRRGRLRAQARGAAQARAARARWPRGSGCRRRCVAGPPRPQRPSSATCGGGSRRSWTGCDGSRSPGWARCSCSRSRSSSRRGSRRAILLLVRAISGPQDVDTWLAFAPMVSSVATAVGLTVTMALLAAGVDRILAGQAAAAARGAGPVEPTEV